MASISGRERERERGMESFWLAHAPPSLPRPRSGTELSTCHNSRPRDLRTGFNLALRYATHASLMPDAHSSSPSSHDGMPTDAHRQPPHPQWVSLVTGTGQAVGRGRLRQTHSAYLWPPPCPPRQCTPGPIQAGWSVVTRQSTKPVKVSPAAHRRGRGCSHGLWADRWITAAPNQKPASPPPPSPVRSRAG